MRTVRRIILENYGPFRGSHAVGLEPRAYAVVGRFEDEPEKSNSSGKSTLCSAIAHALYGKAPFKPEDAWITRGESEGALALEFDDGHRVERRRKRGKSTQLLLVRPGGTEARGDAAEQEIAKLVALSEQDFFLTSFVRQKRADAIVTMDPEPRWRVVSAWLGLEKVALATSSVDGRLETLIAERAKRQGARDALSAEAKKIEVEYGDAGRLDAAIEEARERIGAAMAKAEAALAKLQEETARAHRARDAKRLAEVVAEGKRLVQAEVALPVLEERAAEARKVEREAAHTLRAAEGEHRRRLELAQGRFAGTCPVLPGFACPATRQINDARDQHEAARKDAALALDRAQRAHRPAESALRIADEALEEGRGAVERLRALRAERDRLKAVNVGLHDDAPVDLDVAHAEAQGAQGGLAKARSVHDQLVAIRGRLGRLGIEIEELDGDLAEVDQKIETARAATAILDGTRRAVAERGVGEIAQGASAILAAAGAGLAVEAQWEREARGLASTCGACGAPYPKSQRVRACAACGADREGKTVRRLDFVVEPRSGGLEDLAGVAIQLSAGAIVRAARGSEWAVAVLDESFAAADRSRRRGMWTALRSMLSGAGFSQAFVISHSADLAGAMQGRIEIVRTAAGSVPRVIA